MSLCVVLQEYDRLFMSGDSATSSGNIGEQMVRCSNTAKKITKIGNDIVFCSGIIRKSEVVMNFMKNFYELYKVPIELDQLTTFLQNAIGMQKKQGVYDVGILIGRIQENGQSVVYELSQSNDFKAVPRYGSKDGTQVWCAGFKVEEAIKYATENIQNKLSVSETYIKTYENISCSEVGGTITVFQADKNSTRMILRQQINENHDNITYFNAIGDLYKNEEHAVFADILVGEMVVSEKLKIENKSGTWNLTDNGLEAISGIYSVGINPNVPSEIFNIKIGEDNHFYIDTINNRLKFKGHIEAISGTFSGQITGGSMNIANRFKVDSNGYLTATNANFSGNISGSTITGSTFTTSGSNGTTTISGSAFRIEDGEFVTGLGSAGILTNYGTNFAGISPTSVYTNGSISGNTLTVIGNANVGTLNNSTPITVANKDNTGYTFRPSTHTHNEYSLTTHTHSGYASSSHTQSSYTITPVLTPSENISLLGSPNAASTWWCERTFVSASSQTSDFRLKKNIKSIEELPINLYMELKPKIFEYKLDDYPKGKVMGLIAQQVESAFQRYGLNPYEYNLLEIVEPRSYTDEGQYIRDGKLYRVNYVNFIAWSVHVTQELFNRILKLENNQNSL